MELGGEEAAAWRFEEAWVQKDGTSGRGGAHKELGASHEEAGEPQEFPCLSTINDVVDSIFGEWKTGDDLLKTLEV